MTAARKPASRTTATVSASCSPYGYENRLTRRPTTDSSAALSSAISTSSGSPNRDSVRARWFTVCAPTVCPGRPASVPNSLAVEHAVRVAGAFGRAAPLPRTPAASRRRAVGSSGHAARCSARSAPPHAPPSSTSARRVAAGRRESTGMKAVASDTGARALRISHQRSCCVLQAIAVDEERRRDAVLQKERRRGGQCVEIPVVHRHRNCAIGKLASQQARAARSSSAIGGAPLPQIRHLGSKRPRVECTAPCESGDNSAMRWYASTTPTGDVTPRPTKRVALRGFTARIATPRGNCGSMMVQVAPAHLLDRHAVKKCCARLRRFRTWSPRRRRAGMQRRTDARADASVSRQKSPSGPASLVDPGHGGRRPRAGCRPGFKARAHSHITFPISSTNCNV